MSELRRLVVKTVPLVLLAMGCAGQESPSATQTAEPVAAIKDIKLVGQIGGVISAVFVQGDYAYIGMGPRLVVLDVTDAADPTLVGQTGVLPGIVEEVFVSGSYAYVLERDSGLHIVDISNPASPREVGSYDTPGVASGVYVSGPYAYVAAGWAGLRVLDVSDPARPYRVGSYDPRGVPWPAWDIYVSGSYVYVTSDQGLRVVDISNPAKPEEVAFYNTPGGVWALDLSGDYAYLAAGTLVCG